MTLLPEQLSIGTLVMGSGTPYDVRSGTDLFKSSAHSMGGGERAWADGTWAGAEFADERTLAIPLTINGSPADNGAEVMDRWWALKKACRPIGFGTEVEVRFFYDQEYLVRGRPRLVEPNMDYVKRGFIHVTVGITCPNPLIYAAEPVEVTGITLPVSVGGLTWPIQFPIQFDATQLGGSGELVNAGTDTTGMFFKIHGPVENPTIVVTNDNGNFRINGMFSLSAGEYVDIDTMKRSVQRNGVSSMRGQVSLSPPGIFPSAAPGTNLIEYRGYDPTMTSTLDASLYSAYN